MIKRDGHIHTPFCPHGSKDSFEAYVEEALRLGREEITFTEHFPMPEGVTDPDYAASCNLQKEKVPLYLEAVKKVQSHYQSQIKINRGFEVDYIEGKEEAIRSLLEEYGEDIEDSVLSVHFVLYKGKYYAVDDRIQVKQLIEEIGSVNKVYDLYFETILKSIEADLGLHKPKRIGHPSVIRVYQKLFPCEYSNTELFECIAQRMKDKGYAFDFNVAGLRKETCGETYPSGELLAMLRKYQIPYVGGSDSHEVTHMAVLSKLEKIDY